MSYYTNKRSAHGNTANTGECLVLPSDGVELVSRLFQLSSHVDEIVRGRLCVDVDAVERRLEVAGLVLPFVALLLPLLLLLLQLRVRHVILQTNDAIFCRPLIIDRVDFGAHSMGHGGPLCHTLSLLLLLLLSWTSLAAYSWRATSDTW